MSRFRARWYHKAVFVLTLLVLVGFQITVPMIWFIDHCTPKDQRHYNGTVVACGTDLPINETTMFQLTCTDLTNLTMSVYQQNCSVGTACPFSILGYRPIGHVWIPYPDQDCETASIGTYVLVTAIFIGLELWVCHLYREILHRNRPPVPLVTVEATDP